jgi:hypothetical protein
MSPGIAMATGTHSPSTEADSPWPSLPSTRPSRELSMMDRPAFAEPLPSPASTASGSCLASPAAPTAHFSCWFKTVQKSLRVPNSRQERYLPCRKTRPLSCLIPNQLPPPQRKHFTAPAVPSACVCTPMTCGCAATHVMPCHRAMRRASAQSPSEMGSLKAAPRAARSALSLKGSQQPRSSSTPCHPSATAVRSRVPCPQTHSVHVGGSFKQFFAVVQGKLSVVATLW